MSIHMNRKTTIILLCICIVALLAEIYFIGLGSFNDDSIYWVINVDAARHHLAERVKVGMTRSQVVSTLGKPDDIIKDHEKLERYQQDKSYVPPPPSLTQNEHEVLLFYRCTFWRVYTYMDANNRVNRIHFART